jgi:hypothetical protein
VTATKPDFRKTWLLQAMREPSRAGPHLVVSNGRGRLFIQTLLPEEPVVRLASGAELYRYDGKHYPPRRDTGPAPECRLEVSPKQTSQTDLFLHVLTAADAETSTVPVAKARRLTNEVKVELGTIRVTFGLDTVRGEVSLGGSSRRLAHTIQALE